MNIQEQFNLVAEEYDSNRKKFIPCFDDYYNYTTKFLAANIASPKRILDLGAGTGLLSYFWYQQFPESQYVLVDIADEMLNIARRRFSGIENVSYQVLDYSKELPSEDYDVIVSALSIHHLEDEKKQELDEDILLDAVLWMRKNQLQNKWTEDNIKWNSLSKSYKISDFYIDYENGMPAGCMAITDIDSKYWPQIPQGQSLYIHKLAVKRRFAGKDIIFGQIITQKVGKGF